MKRGLQIPEAVTALINRLDPNRHIRFTSKLRDQRVAAVLGAALGICFVVCFVTGIISHVMQNPPSWYAWPARPAGFYRVTQGLHVATGLLAVPLLFAKLWVVFPKLFEWPPVGSISKFAERISLPPLIGGALFQLLTGIANINQWYFFDFYFTTVHYAVAWITIGALIVHVGAKWAITRQQLRVRAGRPPEPQGDDLSRRNFLLGVFGTGALVTIFSVGQSFTPLGRLAFLSPRSPGVGPQGLPVNRTALAAGVIETARATDWMLTIDGVVTKPASFTLEQLRSLPQHEATLPIACVEGWSQSARWRGVRVRDLVELAGGRQGSEVRIQSLEQGSPYGQSLLNTHHATDQDTLLALELNGEELHIDHGYPCRLIGPNRPGVLQTKWVSRVTVL